MKTNARRILVAAIAALATSTGAPVNAGEHDSVVQPYTGTILFPPIITTDMRMVAVHNQNIGGLGLRETLTEVPDASVEFAPDFSSYTVTVRGTGVVTFLNGEKLFDAIVMTLQYVPAGDPMSPLDDLLVGGTGLVTITGGTGKYKHASGYATLTATFAAPVNISNLVPFWIPFTGQISLKKHTPAVAL
jgi:hypothetical protein